MRIDEQDYAAFVAAARRPLRRVAYAMCGDWHRAEDIVQNVLLRMYLRWSRIDATQGPWSYARRAVVNAVIDEGRRKWRREKPSEFVPDSAMPNEPNDTLADGLAAALLALPAGQRAVVVLRYVDDLDVATVAHLLGLAEGTVKSQASRGLATLRERLGGVPCTTWI